MRTWPADVVALADHIQVYRFAVVGLSAEGPYAVTCGALLPERVVGVGVANGVTDMGWPPAWDGYDPVDASIMRLGDEAAARRWMEEHYGEDGSLFFSFTDLAPADAALLEDQARAHTLLATIVESFRQGGGGLAADLTIQGRPWPFDPSAVRARRSCSTAGTIRICPSLMAATRPRSSRTLGSCCCGARGTSA